MNTFVHKKVREDFSRRDTQTDNVQTKNIDKETSETELRKPMTEKKKKKEKI